jgi:hypothetical protein
MSGNKSADKPTVRFADGSAGRHPGKLAAKSYGGAVSGRTVAVLVIMLSCLALTSCDMLGGSTPIPDKNYHEGSEGLVMKLVGEDSLANLYEDSQFSLSLEISNNGAYDLTDEKQGILSINFDPYYVQPVESQAASDKIVTTPNGLLVKGIQGYGKSRYYPVGTKTFLTFANFKTKKIEGQRAEPSTDIFASLCYPYVTVLSKMVCVDFNAFNQNLRSQVCTQQDLSLTDQGAPVAITTVEVDNQPAGNNLVRPVFTIRVTNKGRGMILSPADTSEGLERVCSSKEMNKADFNTVKVNAQLSDSMTLQCNPSTIRMFDDEGFTRCSVSDDDLSKVISWRQNYQAPLTVNLSYVYLSKLQKKIEIKRFNVFGGSIEDTAECMPFQVRSGDGCINRCTYCAQHPGDATCQPGGGKAIAFNPSFSCSCSAATCDQLYPSGLCAPNMNFCPGASFCCAPGCKASEIRLDDGVCYPKCSQCSAVKADCACGDEVNGYLQVFAGNFCCPRLKSSFTEAGQCRTECAPPSQTAGTGSG